MSRLEKTAVNPHTGTIDLPPELAQNRDIATVPLHDGTQRILAEARRLSGNAASPYVFYRRYRIVPAEDLAEAAKRLSGAAKQMESKKVIPLQRRTKGSAAHPGTAP